MVILIKANLIYLPIKMAKTQTISSSTHPEQKRAYL